MASKASVARLYRMVVPMVYRLLVVAAAAIVALVVVFLLARQKEGVRGLASSARAAATAIKNVAGAVASRVVRKPVGPPPRAVAVATGSDPRSMLLTLRVPASENARLWAGLPSRLAGFSHPDAVLKTLIDVRKRTLANGHKGKWEHEYMYTLVNAEWRKAATAVSKLKKARANQRAAAERAARDALVSATQLSNVTVLKPKALDIVRRDTKTHRITKARRIEALSKVDQPFWQLMTTDQGMNKLIDYVYTLPRLEQSPALGRLSDSSARTIGSMSDGPAAPLDARYNPSLARSSGGSVRSTDADSTPPLDARHNPSRGGVSAWGPAPPTPPLDARYVYQIN